MKGGFTKGSFMTGSRLVCWAGLTLVVLLGGCATLVPQKSPAERLADKEAAERGESLAGNAMLYIETDAGSGQSFSLYMFVNPNFLHMSDSRSPKDYVLFDRKKKVIYSVNSDDKTVFEIHAKPVDIDSPIELNYVETSQPSSAIPKINGRQATHYRYTVNGKHCYDAVVTPPSFLPDVRKALIEFRTVLAGEHASTLNNTPRDMLDACDLAVNIFDVNDHYAHGLPIREWGNGGYQRFLKDYQADTRVMQKLLTVPEGYRHYSLDIPLSGVPMPVVKTNTVADKASAGE